MHPEYLRQVALRGLLYNLAYSNRQFVCFNNGLKTYSNMLKKANPNKRIWFRIQHTYRISYMSVEPGGTIFDDPTDCNNAVFELPDDNETPPYVQSLLYDNPVEHSDIELVRYLWENGHKTEDAKLFENFLYTYGQGRLAVCEAINPKDENSFLFRYFISGKVSFGDFSTCYTAMLLYCECGLSIPEENLTQTFLHDALASSVAASIKKYGNTLQPWILALIERTYLLAKKHRGAALQDNNLSRFLMHKYMAILYYKVTLTLIGGIDTATLGLTMTSLGVEESMCNMFQCIPKTQVLDSNCLGVFLSNFDLHLAADEPSAKLHYLRQFASNHSPSLPKCFAVLAYCYNHPGSAIDKETWDHLMEEGYAANGDYGDFGAGSNL